MEEEKEDTKISSEDGFTGYEEEKKAVISSSSGSEKQVKSSERHRPGIIRGVPSGNQVLIQKPTVKTATPALLELNLSSIFTPRMGTQHKKEESLAFFCREYVRKQLVGKKITYTLEYKLNEKWYGDVYLPLSTPSPSPQDPSPQSIELLILKTGHGKVIEKREGLPSSPKYTQLLNAEKEARAKQLGVWNTRREFVLPNTRNLLFSSTELFDFNKFLKQVWASLGDGDHLLGKGKEVKGIVEYVFNASSYNVLLKDFNAVVRVSINNIMSPNQDKNVAFQGKLFAERLLLHNDVSVVLEEVDQNSTMFLGRVIHRAGDIAKEVLINGFSKFLKPKPDFEKSLMLKYKGAMQIAQKNKKGIWKDYSAPNQPQISQGEREFEARVIDVKSGDSLQVISQSTGKEMRIFLAGIRAPSITSNPPQPYSWESKELVRRITIGKKVRVELEFSKNIPQKDSEETKQYDFATVFVPGTTKKNLTVLLLENGLANLVIAKFDDTQSKYLEQLTDAEAKGRSRKAGLHSTKNIPVHNFKDLVGPKNIKNAKFYEEYFRGEGIVTGTVEHCFSGNKFKLRTNEQNCYLSLCLHGIKCLFPDPNQPKYKQLSDKALEYVRMNFHQRDCEAQLLYCDQKGNYLGYLFTQEKNCGEILLEEGLAHIYIVGSTGLKHKSDFDAAQIRAQEKQLGIWEEGLSLIGSEPQKKHSQPSYEQKEKSIQITEVLSGNHFYIYDTEKLSSLESIRELIKKSYPSPSIASLKTPIRKGTLCCGLFSTDGEYYRARVLRQAPEDKYLILYIDYGNSEEISPSKLKALISPLNNTHAYPPMAQEAALAFISIPDNEEIAQQAYDAVSQQLQGQTTLYAMMFYSQAGVAYYVMCKQHQQDFDKSFNLYLLKHGLARISKNVTLPSALAHWKTIQNTAKAEEAGIWKYEDAELSDSD